MPDGPSTAVVTLSGLGLAFDLIGAFLLSIPMVWNSKQAANWLTKAIKILPGTTDFASRRSSIRFIWITGTVVLPFLHWFIDTRIGFEIILEDWSEHELFEPIFRIFLALLMMFAALQVVCAALADFMGWVAAGDHDKRIGALGLLLLGSGFTLQFIVNMQWVH